MISFRPFARSMLWFALAASAQAALAQEVPPCQSRAMKTVGDARLSLARGDRDDAEKLLERADRECGASYAVLKGISEIYGQLGNPVLAELYRKNSDRYVSQRPSAAPAADQSHQDKSFVRDKFALVVGIGKFRQSDRIQSLKYAAKDATDFAAVLTDPSVGRFPPGNVIVLTDEQATSKAIRSALAEIAGKAMKDDLVLLYFSTHGSSPSMDHTKIGSGYLITSDTEVNDLYATAYGMDALANFMQQKISAERIVTFLDTCYSGDTSRILQQTGSKSLEVEFLSSASIQQIAQGKGAVVITSSGDRELSWESEEKHNSFFTLYLMEAMRERQGLGNVKQLYTDLQRKVPAAVKKYTKAKGLGDPGKGASQNPGIYPMNDIPDIVIGTAVK